MIRKCSSVFVEILAPWRRAVLIFNFFCVFWKVLETNFSHVYSGRAMKDADEVEGQKYVYYQSFGGSENHVLH